MAIKLKLLGYSTSISSSGFHALHLIEQAQDNDFNYQRGLIIVEDSEDMPAREILLLARNLHPNKEKFPILYLNKSSDPDEILLTIREGANEYIINFENQSTIASKVTKHFSSLVNI